MERSQWDLIAYLARYGRQPISEIRRLTRHEASLFRDALDKLVERENKAGK